MGCHGCYRTMTSSSYCRSLTFSVPDSVTRIGTNAFRECANISSLGKSLSIIESGAFYGVRISDLILPQTITSIGSNCFYGNYYLRTITCNASTPPMITNNTFAGLTYSSSSSNILYVPKGSDYSSWMSTEPYYLGHYGWTNIQEIEVQFEE